MTLTKEILIRYKLDKNVFIETGTYQGQGTTCAVMCQFDKIYTIEFYKPRYDDCVHKFQLCENVKFLQGNSGEKIKDILDELDEPAVFWLDAHYDALHVEGDNPNILADSQPILDELTHIKNHHINTHTIMIDDRRIFTGEYVKWHHITEDMLIKKLKEINENYIIEFVDSKLFKQDIIIARIEE